MSSVLIPGNTAVITGASSGIGRAAALYCAQQQMNVWLVDIDEEELIAAHALALLEATTAAAAAAAGSNPSAGASLPARIEYRIVDVADFQAVQALAEEVYNGTTSSECHFLMNNAGIGLGGGALTTDIDTVHRVMGVNTYGPIHGCLAFGPRMKLATKPSLIVNTGSKQGITMPPGNLTYNMSKAALKCYTEGLAHEFQVVQGCLCQVALLIPGWVNTSIVLKSMRDKKHDNKDNAAAADDDDDGSSFDMATVPFHEDKPSDGAWMPRKVIEFMISELDMGRFYIVCPDHQVDRTLDNLRMTWTMQDITENRPPLSRWHPKYEQAFAEYISLHTMPK